MRARVALLGLVFLGGTAGVAARLALTLALPEEAGISVGVLVANLAGAFALGVLVGALGPRAPRVRALVGTGFLGGFTTYSALAVTSARVVADGELWLAVAYGVGTVLVGFVAAFLGIVVGGLVVGRWGSGAGGAESSDGGASDEGGAG